MEWGMWKTSGKIKRLEALIQKDDDLVKQLADLVIQLRVSTRQAEEILQRLQQVEGRQERNDA